MNVMKDFVVSARKYRPDTFKTVVGQDSIASTLKNSISADRLAQAYLFCGPRGVGKTTCARIFAKTINCTSITSEGEACNTCESCNSFNTNRSYNIHELDAASNNSVEDIRSLIEKVRIPPQVSRYSVYIIDEVHMLSQAAFNAFLKTLEEPPKHAIFIMATTEKHKILPTILSRCQIFDFNRISIKDIVGYLEHIAKSEGVDYEQDALNIVAQKADGAMRDALSVFDQIVSFSDNKITYQKVIENLNVLDFEYYFRLTTCFLENKVSECLLIFDDILAKGFDTHNFINGLSRHFRDLLVCKAETTLQLLEVGDSIKKQYQHQAETCSDEVLFQWLELCNACDLSYKSSKNQRLHVELSLIQLCNQGQKKKLAKATVLELPVDDLLPHAQQSSKVITEPSKEEPRPGSKEDELHQTPDSIGQQSTDEQIKDEVKTEFSKPDEPEPKPKPKPKLEGISWNTTTPSIKNALQSLKNPVKRDPEEEENKVIPEASAEQVSADDSPVNKEDLEQQWNTFMESIKESAPRIINALGNMQSSITEKGADIKVSFRNNALLDEFKQNYKHKIIGHLRDKLNNSQIEITEEILDAEHAPETKYYTDLDKLKHMTEKNPALQKLRQDLNLDFD